MKKNVSAADANRSFSRILRGVREDRATYVVTSHGKPVARIVPFESDSGVAEQARLALLMRLRSEPVANAEPWSRESLYRRDRPV